jgi:hypothetical protein
MNRYNLQKIARIAYRDIRSVIDNWEKENDCQFGIHFHWDGCITVDDELFYEHELMDYDEASDG